MAPRLNPNRNTGIKPRQNSYGPVLESDSEYTRGNEAEFVWPHVIILFGIQERKRSRIRMALRLNPDRNTRTKMNQNSYGPAFESDSEYTRGNEGQFAWPRV